MSPTVSVVVCATAPERLEGCLTHLAALTSSPEEVVVVPRTVDDAARCVDALSAFPEARVLDPASRTAHGWHAGAAATSSEVVAFIDDTAQVAPGWLDAVRALYAQEDVAGVGGRVLTGTADDDRASSSEVGRLLPDGHLTANFAADTARVIEVDHLPASNLSLRRTVLSVLESLPGDATDGRSLHAAEISLRLRRLGGRLLFAPAALVRLTPEAEQLIDRRFDRRHLFRSRRDHIAMLARVFGWRAPIVHHYVRATAKDQREYLRLFRGRLGPRRPDGSRRALGRRVTAPAVFTRSAAELAGLAAGLIGVGSSREVGTGLQEMSRR